MDQHVVEPPTRIDAGSRAWRITWRAGYVVARRWGPLMRLFVAMRVPSFDNEIVELALVGRRTGRARPVLLTLIRLDGNWYVGHPNGPRSWLANLAATDAVRLVLPRSHTVWVRGVPLGLGAEREAVIRATAHQQPFGARLLRLAQGHIRRAGIYYRLEPTTVVPRTQEP